MGEMWTGWTDWVRARERELGYWIGLVAINNYYSGFFSNATLSISIYEKHMVTWCMILIL